MKIFSFILVLSMLGFTACKEAGPAAKEAVITNQDFTFCGYCGGWFVTVDSTYYRALIQPPFDKENNKVLIRYKLDERPGFKDRNWIFIESIKQH